MKKNWKRGLSLSLTLALLICSLAGCGGESDSEEAQQPRNTTDLTDLEEAEITLTGDTITGGEKTETVYANADASGKIQEVTVNTKLRVNGTGILADRSNLTDVKNTEGDEAFTQEDGVIYWESLGEDIQYEGTSEQDLPVNVTVTYYLDGKEIAPEKLAGQSGQVTLRFDYENTARETVEVNGEQVEASVPFLAMTALQMDSDSFTEIEVTNGKAVDLGDSTLVVGYALPGLKESLKLGDYEPTEEIEIPDYVEVTAQVENFELAFTATIITSGLFADLETEDLEDADDLVDSMEELSDASTELADGSAQLLEGAVTFGGYLGEYISGISSVKTGTEALDSGLQTLNDNKALLTQGADALEAGLKQLNDSLSQVTIPSGSLTDPGLETALTALGTDAAQLGEALTGMQTALTQLETYSAEVAAYTTSVNQGVEAVQAALNAIEIADSTETARNQAVSALDTALANTDLTEEQKSSIRSQVSQSIDLSQVNAAAEAQLAEAKAALEELADLTAPEAPDLSRLDLSAVTTSISDMQTQLAALAQGLTDLGTALSGLTGLGDMLESLQTGVSQLYTGSQSLSKGMSTLSDGITQLAQGSSQLSSGCAALVNAGSSLSSGYAQLTEGLESLSDGLKTFDEEGIQELSKLAGDDLAQVLTHVRAAKEADQSYTTFAGLSEGMTGSVRFIIETEGIEVD